MFAERLADIYDVMAKISTGFMGITPEVLSDVVKSGLMLRTVLCAREGAQ